MALADRLAVGRPNGRRPFGDRDVAEVAQKVNGEPSYVLLGISGFVDTKLELQELHCSLVNFINVLLCDDLPILRAQNLFNNVVNDLSFCAALVFSQKSLSANPMGFPNVRSRQVRAIIKSRKKGRIKIFASYLRRFGISMGVDEI